MAAPRRPEVHLPVKNIDREGHELRVGDRVGFIMRGWFLPREQESFGMITEIDTRGGVRIELIESYRRFTSSRRIGARDKVIYFTHHVYDPIARQRIYSKKEGEHLLSIFRVDADEIDWHVQEAKEAEERNLKSVRAAAHSLSRRGI